MESIEKDIERFLTVNPGDGSGYGSGDGYGYGYGYGSGDGSGDSDGSGDGDGYGYGYGDGSGSGYVTGSIRSTRPRRSSTPSSARSPGARLSARTSPWKTATSSASATPSPTARQPAKP